MRLISATVRNYRLHRELTVEFDRARTLIGGPNETGKSTLIEAIHRTLFLPARTGAEPQKRMRPANYPGVPEVELTFEAAGNRFHLRKRFSGPSGTATLTQEGGATWHGREAEERLATLLAVSSNATPREATECWGHLWVWQGVSSENPEAHVASQHNALIARLQSSGGAAAMESELDRKVADHVSSLVAGMVTPAGKPKVGSELAAAEADHAAAEHVHREASERLTRLRQAVDDFEQASTAIAAAERDLISLTADHVSINGQRERAAVLLQQLEKAELASKEAAAGHDSLVKTHTQIADLERDRLRSRETLVPLQTELARQEAARRERVQYAAVAELEIAAVGEKLRLVHVHRELAMAQVVVLEKQVEREETSRRLGQAREVEQELAGLRVTFAQLPKIDSARVRHLNKLESECATAQASLAAMAAGLEVLVSDVSVIAGTQTVPAGESYLVTEDTEIRIGERTRLRIRPGGGQSLSEARHALRTARQRLQHALDDHGLTSVTAAAESAARRDAFAAQIKAAEMRCADFDVTALAARLSAIAETLATAEGRIARSGVDVASWTPATELAAAHAAATALDHDWRELEAGERRARAALTAARAALTEADNAFESQRRNCDEQTRLVAASEAQLRMLIETHGDLTTRMGAIASARIALDAANVGLVATRELLSALQPHHLPATAARLQRAIDEKRRLLQESETKMAVAQSQLASDGTRDPDAEFAQADARRGFAEARLRSARQRLAALQLLQELFHEEKRQLADRFTRPLADEVSRYLECVFGSGARFGVSLQENAFTDLQLIRAGDGSGAVAFESLSGGTREQVAAAVRLATAELLSATHDGCLPIVFDDAFAYSDPARVKILQGMLDLAAERGLQIIVLTCNPADYAALGAREIVLGRPQAGSVAAAPRRDAKGNSVSPGSESQHTGAEVAAEVLDAGRDLLRTVLGKGTAQQDSFRGNR